MCGGGLESFWDISRVYMISRRIWPAVCYFVYLIRGPIGWLLMKISAVLASPFRKSELLVRSTQSSSSITVMVMTLYNRIVRDYYLTNIERR